MIVHDNYHLIWLSLIAFFIFQSITVSSFAIVPSFPPPRSWKSCCSPNTPRPLCRSIIITPAPTPGHPHVSVTLVAALAPQSLPPINSDINPSTTTNNNQNINSVKDYFLPTYSEEATRRALEEYAKNKQQSVDGKMIQSEDFIQFDTAMPGVKGSRPISRSTALLPTPTYNKEIDKKEVLWISQQFDIYLRRLPQAVILYALLDFFVLPTSRSVISDELEEDRLKVVGEWASRAIFRMGVFSAIVAVTVVYENIFYHPI